MALEDQIAVMETMVQQALEDFTEAQEKNDPLLFAKEQKLIELQTYLNALKMRKPV